MTCRLDSARAVIRGMWPMRLRYRLGFRRRVFRSSASGIESDDALRRRILALWAFR